MNTANTRSSPLARDSELAIPVQKAKDMPLYDSTSKIFLAGSSDDAEPLIKFARRKMERADAFARVRGIWSGDDRIDVALEELHALWEKWE